MVDIFDIISRHFVIPLSKPSSGLFLETFHLLAHVYKEVHQRLSKPILHSLLNLIMQGIFELCPEQVMVSEGSGSKQFRQYQQFVRMVHEEYTRQHQVSFYADKMNVQAAVLCRLVKRSRGTRPWQSSITPSLWMPSRSFVPAIRR